MKKKTLEAAFRNKRHDLWVKRDLMIEPLKKKLILIYCN